jgi:hypothetical protein
MNGVLTDKSCMICGIPLDAEYFDVSGFVGKARTEIVEIVERENKTKEAVKVLVDPFEAFGLTSPEEIPLRGEQRVLASFQLHPQYCGVLTYFSQYTDLYARDNAQILTPGFEWIILQNGKPVFPYTRLEMIVNPWGYNCLPVLVRLEENARVEFVLRNRGIKDDDLNERPPVAQNEPPQPPRYPIRAFAGRIMGRYWYNDSFGGRVRS